MRSDKRMPRRQTMERFAGTITLAELQELTDRAVRGELRLLEIYQASPETWCRVDGGPKLLVEVPSTGATGCGRSPPSC